jgi:hypothetical protein
MLLSDVRINTVYKRIFFNPDDGKGVLIMFSRRSLITVLVLAIISMISIPAVSLKFTGYLRNHIAPFINEGVKYTLLKDTFELDIEHPGE